MKRTRDHDIADRRCWTLGQLDQAALKLHALAIMGSLADPDEHVHAAAAQTLGSLDQAALTLHAGAIVNVVANAELRVGCPARLCWSFSPSTRWRARCTPVSS